MKTVLITGGAGYLGRRLANRLCAEDHLVTVLDDFSTGSVAGLDRTVDVVHCDVARRLPNLTAHDVVFHLAALSRIGMCAADPVRAAEVNITGTLNVLRSARPTARTVFVSTSAAREPALSVYARTKFEAERVCADFRSKGRAVDVVRPFNIFGADEPETGPAATVVARFLGARARGEPLVVHGTGDQRRDFVHVDDVVDALVLVSRSAPGRAHYDIGTGVNWSVNEVADAVGGPRVYADRPPGEQELTAADPEPLTRLGWAPRRSLPDHIRARTAP